MLLALNTWLFNKEMYTMYSHTTALKTAIGAGLLLTSLSASALTIGYFDSSREYDGNSAYLTNAYFALESAGHTLVATNTANASFLETVDAFYAGLLNNGGISTDEVSALRDFVDVSGGFLFVQQDYSNALLWGFPLPGVYTDWYAPGQSILANWGITSSGSYTNDSGNVTVSSSAWVPSLGLGFDGSLHGEINTKPTGFETLATDDLGRSILGVLEGSGQSGDVFVATDLQFWTGGDIVNNYVLWTGIWSNAEARILARNVNDVPEPVTLALLGIGLMGLASTRRKAKTAKV
jgi:hypothetical protein